MKIPRIRHTVSISNLGEDFSDLEKMHSSFEMINDVAVSRIAVEKEEKILKLIKKHPILRKTDRMVLLAALCSEKLSNHIDLNKRLMINVGSSRGATELWEKQYKNYLELGKTSPSTSPLSTQANISSVLASIITDSNSKFNFDHSLTCSTGLAAIANALAWLKADMADVVIAGGSEASITGFTLAQIQALGIHSKIPANDFPCRPYNIEGENTFVLGEGAGLCLIDMCEKNELKSGDIVIDSIGFSQITPPSLTGIHENGEPLLSAMKNALAKLENKKIDLILSHAPGTVKGDRSELTAIKNIFGSKLPAVFSSKWLTGHTYAASAMLSLNLAQQLFNGTKIPQYPYNNILPYLETKKIQGIMINATGFGGNAISLIVSSFTKK